MVKRTLLPTRIWFERPFSTSPSAVSERPVE